MTDPEPTVTTTRDGAVATITLRRPSALNAITIPMLEALAVALDGLPGGVTAGTPRQSEPDRAYDDVFDAEASTFSGEARIVQPLRVGRQHGLEQRLRARRRLLPYLREPGPGGQADLAAVHSNFARDGSQQRALARAIAADQADPAARVNPQLRLLEQGPAGHAQRHAIDHQQAHG